VDYVRIASVELDVPSRMVRTLDAEGAAAAGQHLAELGHTYIAHIHGPLSFRSTHERRSGFEGALSARGITLMPDMVREGGYTFDGGMAAAEARRAGLRIPEDISIIGFDDTPISGRLWPPLTTVRLPIRDMGAAAARLLLLSAEGIETKSVITFAPEITVRGSTTAPLVP
jgi:LacI family transcriptional regulator